MMNKNNLARARANLFLLDDFICHNPDLGNEWLNLLADCRDEITALRAQSDNVDQRARCVVDTHSVECRLTRFESSVDAAVICLTLRHNNGSTMLEQHVTLSKASDGCWQPTIVLENFPGAETPAGALFQLSDWLLRLGLASQITLDVESRLEALTE
ncbi:hypothetical protein MRO89_14525 [Dickeya dianthicola]|uniref:hypothetical protein n=1 Tax=Dickeya dianthicola TaxID=204039 RepID=UPI001F61EE07|nr:hypothetical protein [Dickeya dianthicola]MCI4187166.1 hypothetical protein [Dickeya dianthicola]